MRLHASTPIFNIHLRFLYLFNIHLRFLCLDLDLMLLHQISNLLSVRNGPLSLIVLLKSL
jgi:hypothetical protein